MDLKKLRGILYARNLVAALTLGKRRALAVVSRSRRPLTAAVTFAG